MQPENKSIFRRLVRLSRQAIRQVQQENSRPPKPRGRDTGARLPREAFGAVFEWFSILAGGQFFSRR